MFFADIRNMYPNDVKRTFLEKDIGIHTHNKSLAYQIP